MANRIFSDVQALIKKPVIIAGAFRPNGTSAVDNTLNKGIGFSVARTNAGIFTITLEDSYPGLISADASVQLNAVADLKAQWGAIDVVTAKTLVLNILAVATATDIASHANNWVHFTLMLKNSTVTP